MRRVTTFLAALIATLSVLAPMSSVSAAAQEATPEMTYACGGAASTPEAMIHEMPMAETPAAGMDHMAMEFDQLYIDMMIPHHQSIIAMAQAASPRLQDERLREIAEAVIEEQGAEIAQLREYREAWYGDLDPMPMDEGMMAAMEQMMPGMGDMESMAALMDAEALVAAFCVADNADLTFIDLTILHHEMAIGASDAALEQTVRQEIRDLAQRVLDTQQREIEELSVIRQSLTEVGTPQAKSAEKRGDSGHHHEGAATGLVTDNADIRALTPDVVAQIERGEGAGLALPAERNGVPGPRHVLDFADVLKLSPDQRTQVQAIFDTMKSAAIPAGQRYLAAEQALEADFRAGTLSTEQLPARVAEVSRLLGELAAIHLAAHLQTAEVLTPDQIVAYDGVRASE